MKISKLIIAFLLTRGLLSWSAKGDEVVLPGFLDANPDQPFALNDIIHAPSMRYQQVFANPGLIAAAPQGMQITSISFYSDFVFTSQQPLFEIDFSTTTRSPDALSTTFSQNVGADDQAVFGPKGMFWDHTLGESVRLTVPFDRPFDYYPSQGNLLMDVRNFQAEPNCPPLFPGGCARGFRGAGIVGDEVSRVYASSVDALTGTADTGGLEVVFTYNPIPEPSSLGILLAGLATFGVCGLRHKRKGNQ